MLLQVKAAVSMSFGRGEKGDGSRERGEKSYAWDGQVQVCALWYLGETEVIQVGIDLGKR